MVDCWIWDRPFSVRFQFRSDQDQMMEMTNDWFQLYALGPLSLTTVGKTIENRTQPLNRQYKFSWIQLFELISY